MRAVYYIILCTGKLINLRPGFFFVCVNIKEGGCDCRLEVNRLAKHLSLAWISEIDIVLFLLRLADVLDINEPQGRLTISYYVILCNLIISSFFNCDFRIAFLSHE